MRQQKIRDWGFRELLPHINYTRYDYLDGGLSNAELHVDNHWDWENGNLISTALNGNWEGFDEPFEVYPGVIVPAGEHGGLRFTLRVEHRPAEVAVGRIQWDVGRFLTGDQNSPTLQVDHPARRAVRARHDVERTDHRSAAGSVPDQSRQHARDLQLHAVGVRRRA